MQQVYIHGAKTTENVKRPVWLPGEVRFEYKILGITTSRTGSGVHTGIKTF